ncbi:hypothetical protein Y032_0748g2023 [Ancylostoma ceylanicum]|nr:hypothetical protein Y032_0748g2023 [Ancylostoma ceylanicum]
MSAECLTTLNSERLINNWGRSGFQTWCVIRFIVSACAIVRKLFDHEFINYEYIKTLTTVESTGGFHLGGHQGPKDPPVDPTPKIGIPRSESPETLHKWIISPAEFEYNHRSVPYDRFRGLL